MRTRGVGIAHRGYAALVRWVVAVVGTLLVVSLIGSARSETRGYRVTWRVEASPFRIVVLRDGSPLLSEATGTPGAGARLSYRLTETGAFHTVTSLRSTTRTAQGDRYVVSTDEEGRTAVVTILHTTRGLSVDFQPGPGERVGTVFEAFRSSGKEHFLGTGERNRVDLRGAEVPLKVWTECASSKPAPFFLSARGVGVLVPSSAIGRLGFPYAKADAHCELGTEPCEIASGRPLVQVCLKSSRLRYEVIPGTPEQVVRAVSTALGRSPLPPRSAFELIKWRDVVSGESELFEDVHRLRAAGIPVSWVILDNPWEVGRCAGSLRFDPASFPDPRGMIARLHRERVRLMLWVSPYVSVGCGAPYTQAALIGTGEYKAIDLTQDEARRTFEGRLRDLVALRIDGFKADRGDEIDFEPTTLAGGSGSAIHNLYPELFARSVTAAVSSGGGRNFVSIFRAGAAGSRKVVSTAWGGDQQGTTSGLQAAVRMSQTVGFAGFPVWGSDIGGYSSERPPVTAAVFARWALFGAISPIMEIGGEGPNARPWELGPAAMTALRAAATLHYELFPLHYELARRASATGVPIVRPLGFHFPGDERSWRTDLELLVGRDLLAAPATTPDTHHSVYLPAGATWIDLHAGTAHPGGRTLSQTVPLSEIPLFLRTGTAIPYNFRSADIWGDLWRRDELWRPDRGGWLLAQAAPGSADSSDQGAVHARRVGQMTEIRLDHAPRETTVLLIGTSEPRSVTVDGRPSPRASSAAALRRLKVGWLTVSAPYRGTLVKRTGPATGVILSN